jgi:hypothetical protein
MSNWTPRLTRSSYNRLDLSLAVVKNSHDQILAQWNLNATTVDVDWSYPTLQYVLNGNTRYPRNMNVIELPHCKHRKCWAKHDLLISSLSISSGPHPIHLHGHDFYVLGSGTGVYSDPKTLNYNNPPRRDDATLAGGGYLVITFMTDNPGACANALPHRERLDLITDDYRSLTRRP